MTFSTHHIPLGYCNVPCTHHINRLIIPASSAFSRQSETQCCEYYLPKACPVCLLNFVLSRITDKNHGSVLPPPPRYPSQAAYNAAVAAGQAAPMIETNNILTHPTGPEYQLLVGEGTARRMVHWSTHTKDIDRNIRFKRGPTPCDTSSPSLGSSNSQS